MQKTYIWLYICNSLAAAQLMPFPKRNSLSRVSPAPWLLLFHSKVTRNILLWTCSAVHVSSNKSHVALETYRWFVAKLQDQCFVPVVARNFLITETHKLISLYLFAKPCKDQGLIRALLDNKHSRKPLNASRALEPKLDSTPAAL